LRLPLEIKTLFREWLQENEPGRAKRVINVLRQMHGGQDYTSAFGLRQTGSGPYAVQIAHRFRLAKRRLGLGENRLGLRTDLFRRPVLPGGQLGLL
jgi:DNA repair photolyase